MDLENKKSSDELLKTILEKGVNSDDTAQFIKDNWDAISEIAESDDVNDFIDNDPDYQKLIDVLDNKTSDSDYENEVVQPFYKWLIRQSDPEYAFNHLGDLKPMKSYRRDENAFKHYLKALHALFKIKNSNHEKGGAEIKIAGDNYRSPIEKHALYVDFNVNKENEYFLDTKETAKFFKHISKINDGVTFYMDGEGNWTFTFSLYYPV